MDTILPPYFLVSEILVYRTQTNIKKFLFGNNLNETTFFKNNVDFHSVCLTPHLQDRTISLLGRLPTNLMKT